MKTKHSKSTWKTQNQTSGDFIIHSDGLRIASVHLIDNKLEERDSNATLIVCAPELLNTLIEIKEYINKMGVVSMAMQNIKNKCTKAINQAII